MLKEAVVRLVVILCQLRVGRKIIGMNQKGQKLYIIGFDIKVEKVEIAVV